MKQTYKITAELNLKSFIAETREVAQALLECAKELEQIERKYRACSHDCDNCVNHGYCDYEVEDGNDD